MEQSDRPPLPRAPSTSRQFATFPGGLAVLRSLTVGGAMLEERDPLPIGNRIRLTLHLGTETVSCTGLVKRSIPDEGMAVEFVDISATDRKRLLEYLTAAAGAESRARLNARLGNASGRAPTIAPSASASAPAAKPPAPLPRLAGLLVQRGTITADQLAVAAAEYRQRGGRFSALLLQLGVVSDEDLAACFNEEYGIPLVDVTTAEPTPEALRLVPYKLARRHEILPIGVAGSTLTVATSDPSNLDGRNEVKFRSGCDLRVAVAPSRAVREAIAYFYRERARDAG